MGSGGTSVDGGSRVGVVVGTGYGSPGRSVCVGTGIVTIVDIRVGELWGNAVDSISRVPPGRAVEVSCRHGAASDVDIQP